MVQHVPTRRTVVRTAAWSVPAISVISAAPAFASSPGGSQPTYQDITKSFIYTALGTIDILVEVTAIDVPLTAPVGATLKPIQTNSKVTIPANLAPTLRSLFLGNADQVSGTSTSVSELTGAITISSPSNLTIPLTPFPAAGLPLVTSASGAGGALSVPANNALGPVVITMGAPSSTLLGHNADGSPNGSTYTSTLAKKAGVDYTLANFNVVA